MVCINEFSNIKPALQSWNNPNLVMICFLFTYCWISRTNMMFNNFAFLLSEFGNFPSHIVLVFLFLFLFFDVKILLTL